MASSPESGGRRQVRKVARTFPLAVGTYVLVLISLQLFLLMVGLEAWLTHDAPLAWGAGITSAVLAASAAALVRFLHGPLR